MNFGQEMSTTFDSRSKPIKDNRSTVVLIPGPLIPISNLCSLLGMILNHMKFRDF